MGQTLLGTRWRDCTKVSVPALVLWRAPTRPVLRFNGCANIEIDPTVAAYPKAIHTTHPPGKSASGMACKDDLNASTLRLRFASQKWGHPRTIANVPAAIIAKPVDSRACWPSICK